MNQPSANERARVVALEDQAWAAAEESLAEFERITDEVPRFTESDMLRVRQACVLIAARVRCLRSQREEDWSSP